MLDPQTPDAHVLLAAISSARGSTDVAENELKLELDLHPTNTSTYRALAGLYNVQGKWQEQVSTLERARTIDSRAPDVKNDLAFLYLEHGRDPNVALSLVQEAKVLLPNSPGVADTLGWAFYKVGSYEPAITQLTIATQRVPTKAAYHYHLGMAYLGAGRLGPAAQSLQQALKIDPKFADAANARTALDTIAKRSQKPPIVPGDGAQ
jgi:Flp pilus assembly protein TadD